MLTQLAVIQRRLDKLVAQLDRILKQEGTNGQAKKDEQQEVSEKLPTRCEGAPQE